MSTLTIKLENTSSSVVLRLSGDIDEVTTFQDFEIGAGKEIIIDIENVRYINSYGCRLWVVWTRALPKGNSIKLINCGPVFLDYVNLVSGFLPPQSSIESFKIPYFCKACNNITYKTFETKNIKNPANDIRPTIDCSHCSESAEIDVVRSSFFEFLNIPKK